eukprot:XP_001708613.1 Hypothetical protein GL50803_18352 [Giardia lamblia ATCC 50803]
MAGSRATHTSTWALRRLSNRSRHAGTVQRLHRSKLSCTSYSLKSTHLRASKASKCRGSFTPPSTVSHTSRRAFCTWGNHLYTALQRRRLQGSCSWGRRGGR